MNYFNRTNGPIYANQTARFDGTARALTEDELFKLAPSVFAVEKHDSRSDRFQPIPTIEIVRALARENFAVVGARQSVSRDPSKRDYTKHMLRFRRLEHDKKYSVGDTIFEINLKNANDGTAAYDLFGGLFRIRCTNSLVSSIGEIESVKVRHTGTAEGIQGKVIDGTYSVLNTAERVLTAPADWGSINLSDDERLLMARAAHVVRFGEETYDEETGKRNDGGRLFDPRQLLGARRRDDRPDVAPDLWTGFNVLQENVIKGGLRSRMADPETHRRAGMREVKGIDQDIKLNKALWILAQGMADLKAAA